MKTEQPEMKKKFFFSKALCAENQELETSALHAITALMKLIGKSIQNDETEISTKKFVDRAIRGLEFQEN
jgi:hypothetical protein